MSISVHKGRFKRTFITAAITAGLVLTGVSPAVAAPAAVPQQSGAISHAEAKNSSVPKTVTNSAAAAKALPKYEYPNKRFTDVPPGHKFFPHITWMGMTGLSSGYSNGSYGPKNTLSREAMAAFMYRQAGSPKFKYGPGFIDVKPGHKFYVPIMYMQAEGISTGVKTSKGLAYQPQGPVTRQAMAAFLYRQAGSPKFKTNKKFVDIKPGHKFYDPIMYMLAEGLSSGIATANGPKYAPNDPVTREAMAAFLYRQAGSPPISTPEINFKAGQVSLSSTGPVIGTNVTARISNWQAAQPIVFKYQWLRNGAAISGATASNYTVTADDAGAAISVRVTGTVGATSKSATSSATSKIPAPRITAGAAEVAQTGRTFTAKPVAWYPLTGISYTYQWFDCDRPIAGATSVKYTVPDAEKRSVSVTITGKLPGAKNATARSTSQPQQCSGVNVPAIKPPVEPPVDPPVEPPVGDLTIEQFQTTYANEIIRLTNNFRATVPAVEWNSGKPTPLLIEPRMKPNGDFQTDFWKSKGIAWFVNASPSDVHNLSGWKQTFPQPGFEGQVYPWSFMLENAYAGPNTKTNAQWKLTTADALEAAAQSYDAWAIQSAGHRDALIANCGDGTEMQPAAWASIQMSNDKTVIFSNIYYSCDDRLQP